VTASAPEEQRYEVSTDVNVDEALAAVGRTAEAWGASWSRSGKAGELRLPVNSGVRAGIVSGRIEAASAGTGTRLVFKVDESHYETNKQAVALLVGGGLSGIVLMLWPFFPLLLGLAPVAIVMALISWFVVGSRIRYNGPQDFLELITEQAGREPEPAESAQEGPEASDETSGPLRPS